MIEQDGHRVTVVIPCYNDGEYIIEALNSVLRQTFTPEKIIIVDDGSSNDTLEILKSIKNDLVTLIFQTNQGVCAARNNGIDSATTSYILTLDADDFFEPTFIEKAKKILDGDDSTGVVCCHYVEFGTGEKNIDIVKPSGHTTTDFLVKNNGVASALFRKECWVEANGYDPAFKNGYEDWDFWLSILSKGWLMEVLKEPLFKYRKKMSSRDMTAVTQFDHELRMQLFDKHKEVYREHFDIFAHQMIKRNAILTNTLRKSKSIIDFKIGSTILKPLRSIKHILSFKNG